MWHPTSEMIADYAPPVAAVLALGAIAYRRETKKFGFLAAYLMCRAVFDLLLSFMIQSLGPHRTVLAYQIYFYAYWTSYTVQALLCFGIIYSVFRLAMEPLKGLQSLGSLMFRWAFGIAAVLSLTIGINGAHSSKFIIIRSVEQLTQVEGVLTLCMLLFVTLAIRPMGLSYTSKLFGVILGLGILATSDMTYTAFVSHSQMWKGIGPLMSASSTCLALLVWATYFIVPEPRRRMILLPTTSPFLRWNQISMALGDAPGFVAVGEVTPEMFAPAELEVMRRASVKMDRLVTHTAAHTTQPEAALASQR